MKRALIGLLLLAAPPALAQQNVPSISFDSVPNPVRLPHNMYFGEVSGVAVNSKGHIFVLSRGNTTGPAYAAAATQLLEFDAKGKFDRRDRQEPLRLVVRPHREGRSAGQYLGHRQGLGHGDQVRSARAASLMVFGRKQEASDEDTAPLKHPKPPLPAEDGRFRQVTDVAWDTAGNTFISDGYINSRVAKVDKDGNWIKSWGDRGKEPGQFNTPHSHRDRRARQCLCRRPRQPPHPGVRRRRQIPAPDHHRRAGAAECKPAIGKMPDEAMIAGGTMAPGSPWSICITPAAEPGALFTPTPFPAASTSSPSTARCWACSASPASSSKQFGWIHAMACPSENTLYVAELLNWRVQKLMLKP